MKNRLIMAAARRLMRLGYFRGRDRLVEALRTWLSNRVLLTSPSGVMWQLDPREELQWKLLLDGDYEKQTADLIRQLTPGSVFVDVGAHIGYFSCEAAKAVATSGRVVAVEPQAENVSHCIKACVDNGLNNVETLVAAVAPGRESGMISLNGQVSRDRSRLSLILDEPNSAEFRFQVYSAPLDVLLSSLQRIDLIKIDVEGLEDRILQSADSTLAKTRAVIVEILDPATSGVPDMLRQAGFSLFDCEGRSWSGGDLLENNLVAFREDSVLFKRRPTERTSSFED